MKFVKEKHLIIPTTRYDSEDTNIQLIDVLQDNFAQRK